MSEVLTNENPQPQQAKKFDLHKVFAAIGIILIVLIIVGGSVWFFVQRAEDKTENASEQNTPATATSSAQPKTSTISANTVIQAIKLSDSYFDSSSSSNIVHTIKFNLPKDWTLKEDDSQNKDSLGNVIAGGHYYSIAGTNNFLLAISEIPGGIGWSCLPEVQVKEADKIAYSEKITANNQLFYLLFRGSKSKDEVDQVTLGSTPNYDCEAKYTFLKANSDINLLLSMSFQKTVTKEYFVSTQEYKTAKNLIESIIVDN